MQVEDIVRVVSDFGQAARRCYEGGLDGCELHIAGHLIGQFWSPTTNQRTDDFGGSLENRARFGLMVLEEIRRLVPQSFVVGVRMVVVGRIIEPCPSLPPSLLLYSPSHPPPLP